MTAVSYISATDPLGHTAPLEYRAMFPLLGVPLEVRSNSPAVLAAAERSFGGWHNLERELVDASEPCVVSLVVHGDITRTGAIYCASPTGEARRPFAFRMHGDCFLAGDGPNLLMAQRDRGMALGFVTPELAADEPWLRHHALELLALLLVSRRDRLPVHAGALVRNGRAILLTGPSMAGKSTLCYAGVRAGFGLLAEDVVYVSRANGMRLWGVPWQIHLLADARERFPELANLPVTQLPNGKHKLAVETAQLGADRPRRYVERALVCLVERGAGYESAIEPIDPAIAVAAFTSDLEVGFDFYDGTREVAEALAAGGAYRLIVGSDVDRAVALLKELTDNG
ncbi:MAG TPA: hypothetical protein VFX76_06780 [Roseiflexaceae bacterium]|nr:hypothetical protein [Roseiflexaceae bacterium]